MTDIKSVMTSIYIRFHEKTKTNTELKSETYTAQLSYCGSKRQRNRILHTDPKLYSASTNRHLTVKRQGSSFPSQIWFFFLCGQSSGPQQSGGGQHIRKGHSDSQKDARDEKKEITWWKKAINCFSEKVRKCVPNLQRHYTGMLEVLGRG